MSDVPTAAADDAQAAADLAIRKAVGQRIATARELLGLTQWALARRVYVTQPAVSQWERGKKLPSLAMQHAIADTLRTTRTRLFKELVEAEQRRSVA